uniref:Uncharacterized protein n=1 Tax=Rhizophagus irregularis (strain DAOM 181602 / DAOM 197198 / MUCL 43194) TaxID=747089 RepID=U9TRR4_RHIID
MLLKGTYCRKSSVTSNAKYIFRESKISDQRVYVMKKVCDDGDDEGNEITSQTGDINGG